MTRKGKNFMGELNQQLERVKLAGIDMSAQQEKEYLASADDVGEVGKDVPVPLGYKRCGACGHAKKFYMYNKNSGSKTNTSGNCKDCQKKSAAESYKKTKSKRNYKKYYQENKEIKQAHARKYYEQNKDALKEKHKAYLETKAGKKVMQRAHAKRRQALNKNQGVPYTRELVIYRDSVYIGSPLPICYICNEQIPSTSGADLHLDHVVPVVEGGMDCFTNVACTHKECNLRREKDARELTAEQVDTVLSRSISYIDSHPEEFGE